MTHNHMDISEGYSLNYLVHSVFLIIGAGILLYKLPVLSPLFLLSALILLLAKTGIYFNYSDQTVMKYSSILGYKVGKKLSYLNYTHVSLVYTTESTLMNSRGSSNVIRTKTYDIVLSINYKNKNVLHDFTDYKLAKQVFTIFTEKLRYEGVNKLSSEYTF